MQGNTYQTSLQYINFITLHTYENTSIDLNMYLFIYYTFFNSLKYLFCLRTFFRVLKLKVRLKEQKLYFE